MFSFVFWNVQRKSRLRLIERLADEYQADFLILAECGDDPASILDHLGGEGKRPFHFMSRPGDRLSLFTRLHPDLVTRLETHIDDRVNVFQVEIKDKGPILIAGVHLHSKLYHSETEQALAAVGTYKQIELIEKVLGINRTVVVGDFNMAPFEPGLVAADSFHALMDKEVVRSRSPRTVDKSAYDMFYNPMWSLMGDMSPGPPGSYFRLKGRISHAWHTFDQVLLRPSLMDSLEPGTLRLLADAPFSTESGEPDEKNASDHFPLHFVLNYS